MLISINFHFLLFAVPSSAPEIPKCNVLSSTSIYVTWSPVPKEGQNGKILGYKIFYAANDRFHENEDLSATTTNQYFTIENALKFTNYTISILAYTSIGDGVKTHDIYCMTHEDGKQSSIEMGRILHVNVYFNSSICSAKCQSDSIVEYENYCFVAAARISEWGNCEYFFIFMSSKFLFLF